MRKNNLTMGVTDFLILFFLETEDCYAYEITKKITERSHGLMVLSQQTVYSATYKLERERMISEYSRIVGAKRTRTYYHLEEAGRAYLEELKKDYANFRQAMDHIFSEGGEICDKTDHHGIREEG